MIVGQLSKQKFSFSEKGVRIRKFMSTKSDKYDRFRIVPFKEIS